MDANTLLPKLALALIPGIGANTARALMARCPSAEAIFALRKRDLLSVPGIGSLMADRILRADTFKRAAEELLFIEKECLTCRFLFDEDYPELLAQCPDAPIILFQRGEFPAPGHRLLSIVGTRNPSSRGKQVTRDLIREIADKKLPVVIVSGLAYGIDIQAHLAALESGLKTIAVLGHGFHTIYPAAHRQAAGRIAGQGCLFSDFFSHNMAEPKNFIRRNRIIAGLSEATLVVESGARGGAMVTAEMAGSYDREVMAIPGRPDDFMSKGCNFLIRTNQASLVESGSDILFQLGWDEGTPRKPPAEPRLFEELDPDERRVYEIIVASDQSTDQLSRICGLQVQHLAFILLNLEFKGLVKAMPGNRYTRTDS
jgi:DNA processing protein